MDADLPTPDRVDLDPYEVEDEAITTEDAGVLDDDAEVDEVEPEPTAAGEFATDEEHTDDGAADAEVEPEPTAAGEFATDDEHTVVGADGVDDQEAAQGDATEDDRLDLDAISADLEGVEAALVRLGDGTYWTDEVTGEPLPDELLAAHPTARRA